MVNINLASDTAERGITLPYKKGIAAVITIFAILVGLYVFLEFYKSNLDKKIKNANAEYASEYKKFTEGNNKNIMDFQNRIILAKDLVEKKNIALENITEIEKTITGGNHLTSFNYDQIGNLLSLNCVADNFSLVAKQLLSFKEKSSEFSDVSVGKASVNSDGKIEFSVDLINK